MPGADYHDWRIGQDAAYATGSSAFEAAVYRYMSQLQGQAPLGDRAVLNIPVVVHLMHDPADLTPNNQTANLTDDRVQEAIDLLNEAFRNAGAYAGGPFHTNAGIPATDVEIEFCLANYDLQGAATSGIVRVPTTYTQLYREDDCPGGGGPQDVCLKALSTWDTRQYLNIWVVEEICTMALGGDCDLRGYASMPGAHGMPNDGIVIEANYFGSSPEATTELVHQAGRYLGLFPTYYQQSFAPNACMNDNCLAFGDGICDTPPDSYRGSSDCQAGETYNSCSTDANDTTANNPFDSDVQDMYENFMDAGLGCRNTFTPMQRARMRFALINNRKSLLQSSGCSIELENASLGRWIQPPSITCDSLIAPKIWVHNTGESTITDIRFEHRVDQLPALTYQWTGNLLPGDSVTISTSGQLLNPGPHQWQMRILEVNQAGPDDEEADNVARHRFIRLRGRAPITEFPYCNDLEAGPFFFDQVNFDGQVGFDYFGYSQCANTTGEFVLRYNSSGLWDGGSGMSAGPEGTRDALVSPPIDLRGYNQAALTFVTAYKESYPDKRMNMQLWVLPSCGAEEELVYEQNSSDLESSQTAYDPAIVGWVPNGCSEWRSHAVDLSDYTDQVVRLILMVELEGEYSQNFYLDNFCLEAANVCALPPAIPQQSGRFVADTACAAPDGWTHYWKYAGTQPRTPQDVLLFSVFQPDSQQLSLPPQGVSMDVTEGYGNGGHDLSAADYVANPLGWRVAGRYWRFQPDQLPTDSVQVRIYLDQLDLLDLMPPAISLPAEQWPFTVYRMAADPDPQQGHAGVTPAGWSEYAPQRLSGPTRWHAIDLGNYFAIELQLADLDGLGIGISGDEQGIGPTYPARLEAFEGTQELGQIQLKWSVPREVLSDSFHIWRRALGEESFTRIGAMPAQGSSWVPQAYQYADVQPLEGTAEYTVSLSHAAPMQAFSDTILLRFDPARRAVLYPNPVAGRAALKVEAEPGQPVQVEIYNAGWQRLYHRSWKHSTLDIPQLDLTPLPPGVYFFVVRFYLDGKAHELRGKVLRIPEG